MMIAPHIKDLVTMTEQILKDKPEGIDLSRVRHIRSHLKDAMYIAEGLGLQSQQTARTEATDAIATCTCPAYPHATAVDCPVHGQPTTNF